jgi:hypothetical protein
MRSHLYVLQITQADVAIKRRVLQANGDAGFGGVMDKAYQEALNRIPEPKEKYDPLGRMTVHYCNSLATAIEKMRAVRSSATLIFPSPP